MGRTVLSPVSTAPPIKSFSAVSLTPVINFKFFGYFWPVSTTPGKNFITGVNDTADKFSAGVNDTADKLFIGVNDTADKLFTDDKLYWRQRSVLSANRDKSMISSAAEVGHGRQSWKVASIGTPHILIRGPWGRRIKSKRQYLVSAASGASDHHATSRATISEATGSWSQHP